jgi:predicted MFS family arabinose efflux permease
MMSGTASQSASVVPRDRGRRTTLAGLVRIESRSRDPLLPLHLLRVRNVHLGVAIAFLFMATFGTLLYFLTVYFQRVRGFSALHTGVACLVPMAAVLIGSTAGGHTS